MRCSPFSLEDMDRVIEHFKTICRIPHGSGNCLPISEHLLRFAEEHALAATRDAAGNVIIRKPASPGYEDAPAMILQGHVDMVCEKDADSTHDFSRDPLQLIQEDDWLFAKGTTLGGDDGIAVAYMLAILESGEIPHPALECLFTVDETVFVPQPKVKSGVIRLWRNTRENLECDWEIYKSIIKTTFGQRRKTLRNSIRQIVSPEIIAEDKETAPLLDLRPEQLGVEEFIHLALLVENNKKPEQ